MKMKYLLSIGMFAAVLLAACNDDDNNDDALNAIDRDFVVRATQANRAEIELGGLAASKGSDDNVRVYGQSMVSEHTTALNELLIIADDRNVNTPENLDQEHQQLKERLQDLSGYTFDSAYMNSQLKDHQKTKILFEIEIANGKDQRTKDYANKYLPHIQMHLENAIEIRNALPANKSGD